jgi:hypothetical protein
MRLQCARAAAMSGSVEARLGFISVMVIAELRQIGQLRQRHSDINALKIIRNIEGLNLHTAP